jgi:thiamine-monophosphate kinase
MKIQDIGEKKFLSMILPTLKQRPDFLNGFGHDASIIDLGLGDTAIVMKIDRAGKPVATLNGWTDYSLWGRLAVTANCSDILAVGGIPKGFMLSISVPRTWQSDYIKQIIMGAQEECNLNNISFLGGDTKESNEPQVVGSAIGIISKDYFIGRNNATDGDYLVLAGQLGGFVSAYTQLKDKENQSNKESFIEYLAYPKARWKESMLVNSNSLACGGTDLSDGFYDALRNIVSHSYGTLIYLDDIPYHQFAIDAASKYSIPLFNLAFSVGDWSMLFAVKKDNLEKLLQLTDEVSIKMKVIGRVIKEEGVYAFDSSKDEFFTVDGIVNENFLSRMEDGGSFFDSIKNKNTLRKIDSKTIAALLTKYKPLNKIQNND